MVSAKGQLAPKAILGFMTIGSLTKALWLFGYCD
jgi:hypothetical protein